MDLLTLAKQLTPRGLGIKLSKNPNLKKELYKLTSFLPEDIPQSIRIWCLKNDILSEDKLPKCPVCGKLPAYSTGQFRTYCSKRCAQLDKEKFLKKYGVEHHLKLESVKEKRKKTVLQKYGVENIGIITREKAKKTTLKKYGVDNYTKTAEYKIKAKKTSLKKYGTTHPMKSTTIKEKVLVALKKNRKEITEKTKQSLLEKYGVETPMHIPHVKEKVLENYKYKVWERLLIRLKKHNIKPLFDYEFYKKINVKDRNRFPFLCLKCGNKFLDHLDNGNIPLCPVCTKTQTKPERVITKFLKEKSIRFETGNRKILKSLEIDIYVPDRKIAIEVNGIYYHTYENLIKLRNLSPKQAKNYHRLKWILATEKGIRIIQFWDSEIINKKDIVFSIIGSALGLNKKIYAKNCKIEKIGEKQAYEFFIENHIYNQPVLAKNYALVFNGEILQVISIGKARFGLDGYEIYRIATKNGFNVIGGTGKLIKYVLKDLAIKKLYSYVDLRLFTGKSLEKLGFKRIKITKPDYYYTKDYINLVQREWFMKSKTGISEKLFAEKNGYKKIYGVGNALYLLET